jgi:hypothetical protein
MAAKTEYLYSSRHVGFFEKKNPQNLRLTNYAKISLKIETLSLQKNLIFIHHFGSDRHFRVI